MKVKYLFLLSIIYSSSSLAQGFEQMSPLSLTEIDMSNTYGNLTVQFKGRLSGFPIKQDFPFLINPVPFKVPETIYGKSIFKRGILPGMLIGGVIGSIIGLVIVNNLTNDGFLDKGSSDSSWLFGWFAFNGTGLGGFSGSNHYKRRQRRLHANQQSLPTANITY